ncbi:MAG: chemotaxis protein CheW [Candidatus Cloacimonetes bacterium]|jgi:purine-binding chemotaxis protein CheW|nr:chemotaxis protein CheW [Candidatus Cloacimonadota bacterium]MDD4155853.1 chemotaxis protein CheW [Candidatus Cloacimonadota bacterium]
MVNETQKFCLEGKYLTFNLMEEFYGVNVEHILQIIAIPEITKIPKTPDFVKGVINLRGKIIPVIDLRIKFKLPEQQYNDRTSIVIIKLKTKQSEIFIGIIIDKVLEVLDIHNEEIEDTPTFGVQLDTEFILGMAKVKNKVVTLLNINKILTETELTQIEKSKK